MAFSPSNQYFCIKFLQWSKFVRKKKLRLFYFAGTCGWRKKSQKSQKFSATRYDWDGSPLLGSVPQ